MKPPQPFKAQVRKLPRAQGLLLENIIEDQLEISDHFKAKIARGERDLREGRVRIRKPARR